MMNISDFVEIIVHSYKNGDFDVNFNNFIENLISKSNSSIIDVIYDNLDIIIHALAIDILAPISTDEKLPTFYLLNTNNELVGFSVYVYFLNDEKVLDIHILGTFHNVTDVLKSEADCLHINYDYDEILQFYGIKEY